MTNKHTPGPWKLSETAKACILAKGDDCGSFTVCVMQNRHRPEQESNARLIAAAPDLLAACKAAQVLGTLAETHTPAQVSAMLDEAIARAEGK